MNEVLALLPKPLKGDAVGSLNLPNVFVDRVGEIFELMLTSLNHIKHLVGRIKDLGLHQLRDFVEVRMLELMRDAHEELPNAVSTDLAGDVA